MNTNALTHRIVVGNTEAAMYFYTGLLPASRTISTQIYTEGESKSKVQQARFELNECPLLCTILVPLGEDGGSALCGWVSDRPGSNWQFNLI